LRNKASRALAWPRENFWGVASSLPSRMKLFTAVRAQVVCQHNNTQNAATNESQGKGEGKGGSCT
jgi:hypothetical protein